MTIREVARKYYNKYFDITNEIGKEDAIKLLIEEIQKNNDMEDFIRGTINIIFDQHMILKHYESNMRTFFASDPVDLSRPISLLEEDLLLKRESLFNPVEDEELKEAMKPVESEPMKKISDEDNPSKETWTFS